MRPQFRPIAIIGFLIATFGSAQAGSGAALNPLGFSPDGRYFAFEQYGEQDGSGTRYSSITILEVAGDRLVRGTPVTVAINPEDPDGSRVPRERLLGEVRASASLQAAPLIRKLNISEAGRLVAAAPASRAREAPDSSAVKSIREAAVRALELPDDIFGRDTQLVLREFDIALPRCKGRVSEHPNGFGLTLERKGRPTIHLSRDQTIPPERGCPDRYGIAEVHALQLSDGSTALAVMVQYFYAGFEGPDRRFLAVTGRIK